MRGMLARIDRMTPGRAALLLLLVLLGFGVWLDWRLDEVDAGLSLAESAANDAKEQAERATSEAEEAKTSAESAHTEATECTQKIDDVQSKLDEHWP